MCNYYKTNYSILVSFIHVNVQGLPLGLRLCSLPLFAPSSAPLERFGDGERVPERDLSPFSLPLRTGLALPWRDALRERLSRGLDVLRSFLALPSRLALRLRLLRRGDPERERLPLRRRLRVVLSSTNFTLRPFNSLPSHFSNARVMSDLRVNSTRPSPFERVCASA